MPTDDIFDQAWNVAKGFRKRGGPLPKTGKNERFECGKCGSDCRVPASEGEEATMSDGTTTCWDRWHSSEQHEQDMAGDDFEKGFFSDFSRKVKEKQREQEALNAHIVENLIRHPDGLEQGVLNHRRALEQMNRLPAPDPESIDEVRAEPPRPQLEAPENQKIEPETVRAEIPGMGFKGGAKDAPTPPKAQRAGLHFAHPDDELDFHEEAGGMTARSGYAGKREKFTAQDLSETTLDKFFKKEAYSSVDDWTVVKDPFANPFFNPNFSDLTENQAPEVTQDTSPTYSVQPDLLKGDSPEEALDNAGFDARSGDDMSLLPSSAFDQEGEAPKGNTSLLPAGWDSE